MDRVFKGLRSILYGISVAAMAVMLVVIFAQVVSRYLFGYSFEWSEELARFLFVWVVFLGSALIMGEGGHLAVEILPKALEGTWAGVLVRALINLAGYAFILLLIVQGTKMVEVMTFQIAPGLKIPMSWVYMVIPLSGALMLLYLVKDTAGIVRGAFTLHKGTPVLGKRGEA